MSKPVRVPEIPEAEQTPLVRGLMGIIEEQAEQLRRQEELIGQLRDEVGVLKGEKQRPRFKASGMEEKAGQDTKESEARSLSDLLRHAVIYRHELVFILEQ